MTDGSTDPRTVRRILVLETALARRDASAIDGGLEALIDADFVEFGSSGRRWDRPSTIAQLSLPPSGALTIGRFTVDPLADGVLLATYRSVETTPEGARRATRRVSIWVRRGRDWRIRFHQGTSIPLERGAD